MKTPQSDDVSVYSITFRKMLMIAFAALFLVGIGSVILQSEGFINVERFGIPENYFYILGFGVAIGGLIPIFIVWRCPGCRAYLGKEASPSECRSCGAKFR